MNYLPPGGAYTEDKQRRWEGFIYSITLGPLVIAALAVAVSLSGCAGWHGNVIGAGSPCDEHLTQPKLYPENSPEREREHEFNERHMDAITR